MPEFTTKDRCTINRGAQHQWPDDSDQRLVWEISKSFRLDNRAMEKRAQQEINAGKDKNYLWQQLAYTHFNSPEERRIYTRYFLQYFSMAWDHTPSDEELFVWLVGYEKQLQVHDLQVREESEYQIFLQEVESIRRQLQIERTVQGAKQLITIHPAQIRSSVFRMGAPAQPFYELYQYVAPYLSFAVDFIPIVETIKGIAEATFGRDSFTGEEIPTWARGLGAALSFLPFCKGVFSVARVGVRLVTRATRKTLQRLALLACLMGDVDLRKLYRASKKLASLSEETIQVASSISAGKHFTAGQQRAVDDIVKAFADDVERGASRLSRSASGVVEDSRGLQRAASGTSIPKPVVPARIATRTAARLTQELVSKGYLPEAIGALERLGVTINRRLINRLDGLGNAGRDFINLFHRSSGFHWVVQDLGRNWRKAQGAEFVMRYATGHADIVAKARANPALINFEWGAGITIGRTRAREYIARHIDIVVRGDRTLGEGDTIYHELKNWTASQLERRGEKLQQQFVKDVAILDPKNIRWVFNSAKIANRDNIIEAFLHTIQKDAYLTKIWGKDPDQIRAALRRVIQLYPPI